jgi:DNA repair protein RecN (Recombination protein N)
MITTLHIKNIGIIDDLSIELGQGFNVFTGETGAGKTLIIDALNIISGGRFSKEMIRKGENYSFVELNLFLPDNENAIDGNIIISREIYSNGRNSCKINGRLVTVAELRDFATKFIDIHGQNDNQKILDSKNHIKYLDNFCGESLLSVLKEYRVLYKRYIETKKELKENLGDDKEKKRELDLLQYQLDEIENANLKIGEDEKLQEKSIMFANYEKVAQNLSSSNDACKNAVDYISEAIKSISKIENVDKKYSEKLTELKNIYYEIDEFSRDLSDENDDMYFDTNERDEVEDRLDLITSLKRKYGNTIEEILNFEKDLQNRIDKINNLDEINSKLKKELKELENKMQILCDQMSLIREEIAKKLSSQINNELKDLEMNNAEFFVKIDKTEMFTKRGKDDVKFFISTNIGEEMKELGKVASGGEMSRIMLAMKTVLSNTDKTPVMIFDEIDTGISGKAAKSVGQKLKLIGKKHQVICITHQPCIAAKGDQNYFIAKVCEKDRTHTVIKKLNKDEVINEIARISNGEVTEIARKHAIELMKTA